MATSSLQSILTATKVIPCRTERGNQKYKFEAEITIDAPPLTDVEAYAGSPFGRSCPSDTMDYLNNHWYAPQFQPFNSDPQGLLQLTYCERPKVQILNSRTSEKPQKDKLAMFVMKRDSSHPDGTDCHKDCSDRKYWNPIQGFVICPFEYNLPDYDGSCKCLYSYVSRDGPLSVKDPFGVNVK